MKRDYCAEVFVPIHSFSIFQFVFHFFKFSKFTCVSLAFNFLFTFCSPSTNSHSSLLFHFIFTLFHLQPIHICLFCFHFIFTFVSHSANSHVFTLFPLCYSATIQVLRHRVRFIDTSGGKSHAPDPNLKAQRFIF